MVTNDQVIALMRGKEALAKYYETSEGPTGFEVRIALTGLISELEDLITRNSADEILISAANSE